MQRIKPDVLSERSELLNRMLRPPKVQRGRRHWARLCVEVLGRPTNTSPNAGHRLVMAHDAARLDIREAGLNRLAHVDLVGEIVPGCGIGKGVDELARVGLDIVRIAHGGKLALERGDSKLADSARVGIRLTPQLSCKRVK